MDKVIEKVNELSDEIQKLPEVIEFLKNKELLENNQELQGFRLEIAKLTNDGKLKERDELIAKYKENPLVNNYENSREEVLQILNSIKEIIK